MPITGIDWESPPGTPLVPEEQWPPPFSAPPGVPPITGTMTNPATIGGLQWTNFATTAPFPEIVGHPAFFPPIPVVKKRGKMPSNLNNPNPRRAEIGRQVISVPKIRIGGARSGNSDTMRAGIDQWVDKISSEGPPEITCYWEAEWEAGFTVYTGDPNLIFALRELHFTHIWANVEVAAGSGLASDRKSYPADEIVIEE